MPKYNVVLNFNDGTVLEREYFVRWDAEKVPSDEVARACAAQTTVEGGKNSDGTFKRSCAGISAQLIPV